MVGVRLLRQFGIAERNGNIENLLDVRVYRHIAPVDKPDQRPFPLVIMDEIGTESFPPAVMIDNLVVGRFLLDAEPQAVIVFMAFAERYGRREHQIADGIGQECIAIERLVEAEQVFHVRHQPFVSHYSVKVVRTALIETGPAGVGVSSYDIPFILWFLRVIDKGVLHLQGLGDVFLEILPEAFSGYFFHKESQIGVIGIAVAETASRLEIQPLGVGAHQLVKVAVLQRVLFVGPEVLGCVDVILEAGPMLQEFLDGDFFEREVRKVRLDRPVDVKLAFLVELHDGYGGERLGKRCQLEGARRLDGVAAGADIGKTEAVLVDDAALFGVEELAAETPFLVGGGQKLVYFLRLAGIFLAEQADLRANGIACLMGGFEGNDVFLGIAVGMVPWDGAD